MKATSPPRLDAEMVQLQSLPCRMLYGEAPTQEVPSQCGRVQARVGSVAPQAPEAGSDRPQTPAGATVPRRVSRWLPGLFASVGTAMVVASVATLCVPSEAAAAALLGSTALLPVLIGVGLVAERMDERSVEGGPGRRRELNPRPRERGGITTDQPSLDR